MKVLKPAIILVRPQLPENIGMVARVMQNFNLKDLILVKPREKWPNNKAIKASKNASSIIKKAKIYNSIPEAISAFKLVIATTNRKRFLEKKSFNQFKTLNKLIQLSKKSAILFGPENSGLSNEDLRLADFLFTIDTSNNNHSLNLSHAVAITSYQGGAVEMFTHTREILDEAGFERELEAHRTHASTTLQVELERAMGPLESELQECYKIAGDLATCDFKKTETTCNNARSCTKLDALSFEENDDEDTCSPKVRRIWR